MILNESIDDDGVIDEDKVLEAQNLQASGIRKYLAEKHYSLQVKQEVK